MTDFFRRFVKDWDRRKVTGVVAVVASAVGLWGWLSNHPFSGNDACASAPLRHVYKPSRLQVIATCQKITFDVVAWRLEHDGDYHVNGIVVGGSGIAPVANMLTTANHWIDSANVTGQHDLTVIEFVPGDPRPPVFHANQVLQLTVTKVYDQGHRHAPANGWIEGHPVFAAKDVTPSGVPLGPDRPKLAPPTEEP